ncbi:MAG: hypothetical protein A3K10_16830 [Bacteroidetes bacterium RIFCSPLOWO2_12_FULL_31_6]|nr:MAG: hypothetical protein A3K10_16830 [Bacteroidetes bacterium RIFCSPLOWO2_12_FULL_31_6]
MKFLIVILALLIGNFSIAQNRKELLKEIHTFENETYTSTKYKTNLLELKLILTNYFTNIDYVFQSYNGSSFVFSKRIKLTCRRDGNKKMYGSSYQECFGSLYVTIDLINNIDSTIQIEISTRTASINEPFSEPFSSQQLIVLGNYKFNETKLYKYLHHHFKEEELKIPKELITKIETYNIKQKDDTKKLIAGRDY